MPTPARQLSPRKQAGLSPSGIPIFSLDDDVPLSRNALHPDLSTTIDSQQDEGEERINVANDGGQGFSEARSIRSSQDDAESNDNFGDPEDNQEEDEAGPANAGPPTPAWPSVLSQPSNSRLSKPDSEVGSRYIERSYTFGSQMVSNCTAGVSNLSNRTGHNWVSSPSTRGQVSGVMSAEAPDPDVFPELVSFRPGKEQELLRASSLTSVMRWQGGILKNSSGSALTFGLSREVQQINTFLSHNWSTPRLKKFLGMAHHFNFCVAQLGAFLVMVLIVVLTIHGYVPTIGQQSSEGEDEIGFLGRLLVYPAFMVLILFWRDFQGLFGLRGPDVFLDKTCIHQVDASLKQRGIEKLPAFLNNSRYMLALYTDSSYLTKMWTVYEVAAFLASRPSENMVVCELNSVQIFYGCLFLAWLSSVLIMVARVAVDVPDTCESALWCLFALVLLLICRGWAISRSAIYNRLRQFDVRACHCTFESDRAVLEGNIAVLMRARSNLPHATEQEALDVFNTLVRTELPKVFAVARHPLAFSYMHVASFAVLWSGTSRIDTLPLSSGFDTSWWELLGEFGSMAVWWLIWMPVAYGLLQFVANSFLNLRGWRAWVRLVPLFLLMIVPAWGVRRATFAAGDAVDDASALGCVALLAMVLVGGTMVRVLYTNRFWEVCYPHR